MATFRIDMAFYLQSRDLVVLVGDILEGEVGRGMTVDLPGLGLRPVHSAEFVRFADGRSLPALTVAYADLGGPADFDFQTLHAKVVPVLEEQ